MIRESTQPVASGDLSIVKVEPRLTTLRRQRVYGFWSLGVWIVLIIGVFVFRQIYHVGTLPQELTSLIGLPAYLAIGLLVPPLLQISAYKKIEQRRQMAVQGGQQSLAEPQPATMVEGSGMPLTIKYEAYQTISPALVMLVIGLVVVVIGESIWLGFSLYLTLLVFAGIVSLAIFFIRKKRNSEQELIADETGLSLRIVKTNKVQRIPWQEARLFAIDTYPDEPKQKVLVPRIFELASAQEVINWPSSGPEALKTWKMTKPVLTEAEYGQQLAHLHALIVEKTGLKLYDLRNQ